MTYQASLHVNHIEIFHRAITRLEINRVLSDMAVYLRDGPDHIRIHIEQLIETQLKPYDVGVLREQMELFDTEMDMRMFIETEKLTNSNALGQLTELSMCLMRLCKEKQGKMAGIIELPSVQTIHCREKLDQLQELCHHNLSIIRQRRKKIDMCVICLDRYADRLIVPCMHLCLCRLCSANSIQRCPICKTPTKEVRHVYR